MRPIRPGPGWRLSDSEVLTLGVLAQFLPHLGERSFLNFVRFRFPGAFPTLPEQSGYNRHLHDIWGVWAWLGPAIARKARELPELQSATQIIYEAVDGTGVSLMSKKRGNHSSLYGDGAAIGKGGVDRQYFYGVKLAVLVCNIGLIHGFTSGPANTEERFLFETLLRFRHNAEAEQPTADDLLSILGPSHRKGGKRKGPSGPLGPCFGAGIAQPNEIIFGDDGFAGQDWQAHWQTDFEIQIMNHKQAEQAGWGAWFSRKRQVVESVFSRLHGFFQLERPRTKSLLGWWIRLAAKIAAHNVLIILNALFQKPLGSKLDIIALP